MRPLLVSLSFDCSDCQVRMNLALAVEARDVRPDEPFIVCAGLVPPGSKSPMPGPCRVVRVAAAGPAVPRDRLRTEFDLQRRWDRPDHLAIPDELLAAPLLHVEQ